MNIFHKWLIKFKAGSRCVGPHPISAKPRMAWPATELHGIREQERERAHEVVRKMKNLVSEDGTECLSGLSREQPSCWSR